MQSSLACRGIRIYIQSPCASTTQTANIPFSSPSDFVDHHPEATQPQKVSFCQKQQPLGQLQLEAWRKGNGEHQHSIIQSLDITKRGGLECGKVMTFMAFANHRLSKPNIAILPRILFVLYVSAVGTSCLYSVKGPLKSHGLFLRGNNKGGPIQASHGTSEQLHARDPGVVIRHPPWISGCHRTRGTIRLRGGSQHADMGFFTKLWENQEGKDETSPQPDFLESLWETWKTSLDVKLQEANEFRSVMHERLLLLGWQVCRVPSMEDACLHVDI
jgi:hypothetical protein